MITTVDQLTTSFKPNEKLARKNTVLGLLHRRRLWEGVEALYCLTRAYTMSPSLLKVEF